MDIFKYKIQKGIITMKRNHRLFRAVSVTLAVLLTMLATLSIAACGSRKPIIGILQFGSHESLNNCYDGIMQGLEESGLDLSAYDIRRLNSNFDMTTAQSQAKTLVNKGAAVILAIATPLPLPPPMRRTVPYRLCTALSPIRRPWLTTGM